MAAGTQGIHSHHHICFQKRWKLAEQHWLLLGECRALIRAISNTAIRPDFRSHLQKVSLIRGAQATTAIEGNTLTEEDIVALREGRMQLPPSREYLQTEVENVIQGLNAILTELMARESSALITPEFIRRFHRMIGQGIGDAFAATPGEYRRNNVTAGPYRAPHFEHVPALVDRLCEWLRVEFHYGRGQSFADAVIQAIVTHVYIVPERKPGF